MRLPRLRFSIRWMMIAVMIFALAFTAEIIRRNEKYCRGRERYHAHMADLETKQSRMAEVHLRNLPNETERGMFQYVARTRAERAAWHEVLRKKWQRGVSHPWELVEMDPPTPEDYGPIDYDPPVYPSPGPPDPSSPLPPQQSGTGRPSTEGALVDRLGWASFEEPRSSESTTRTTLGAWVSQVLTPLVRAA